MATFSVVLFTAPPTGQGAEAGGPFVKIDGRESLIRAAELFLNRDEIKQIQVVFDKEAVEDAKRKHGGHFGFSGIKLVSGGPRWIDQLVAANEKISPEATHVIVHDAARPAVAYYDLDNIIEAAQKNPIVALTSPIRTPIVEIDESGHAVATHSPSRYQQLLTPMAFTRERFAKLAADKTEPHASELTLLKGSPLNVRVGGAGDASLVNAMIRMLPKPKVKGPSSPFEEAQW